MRPIGLVGVCFRRPLGQEGLALAVIEEQEYRRNGIVEKA